MGRGGRRASLRGLQCSVQEKTQALLLASLALVMPL
jgi:hypothetical protein